MRDARPFRIERDTGRRLTEPDAFLAGNEKHSDPLRCQGDQRDDVAPAQLQDSLERRGRTIVDVPLPFTIALGFIVLCRPTVGGSAAAKPTESAAAAG